MDFHGYSFFFVIYSFPISVSCFSFIVFLTLGTLLPSLSLVFVSPSIINSYLFPVEKAYRDFQKGVSRVTLKNRNKRKGGRMTKEDPREQIT